MSQENAYLLGHADQEMERLKLQAACLEGPDPAADPRMRN